MSSHHQHRIDRETVERLLDGVAAVERRQVPDDLVRLLDAARAAPRSEELRGEHLAVQAFHAARSAPARRPSRRPVRRGALARLLPAKTIAALAVAATGGMALATVQGAVPNPLRPEPPATTTPVDGPSGGVPERVRTAPTHGPPTHGPPGGGPRSPELVPACRSWRDARAVDPDRALRDPAFASLLRAAGGRDRVDAWCDTVLGGGRTPGPSTGAPGDAPTTGPGGPPPAPPTGRPAVPSVHPARPTGPPTVPTPPVDDVPGRPGPTDGPSEPVVGLPEPGDGPPEPGISLPEPDDGLPEPGISLPEPGDGPPGTGVGLPEPTGPGRDAAGR
ncbi:hypothetical protein [Micromonospora sp. NBRC 101691]|uniref:hypothetical protein n=1 Tax=Micromonospora sp. NBRC 101691 TaxID=3032198 RepID=UPI0024A46BD1|nr:hypothetical protein [Micromonospora sp. NBRC 101691]GLY21548.1 hypothetical protein Misp04_12800 [Micromonospora sp. NBRC 101691]